MKSITRYSIGAGCLAALITVAGHAASPAPDPATWQPASIAGPALFIGEVSRIEDFRNPPNTNYDCHVVMSGPDKTKGSCFSNACGLETISIKTGKVFAGRVPPMVSLNSVLGEWCESVSAKDKEFLVAILPDMAWTVFEILGDGPDPAVLPNYRGCLGDLDIKPLLQSQGKDLAPGYDGEKTRWRKNWNGDVHTKDCDTWIPQDQENKTLTLDALVALWNGRKH
jgi:hypothetical protein